ncbi:hypothetical protein ES702_07285 [subsurface metagenome]
MPKVENPLTGRKTELTNWKAILGLIGGGILILGIFLVARWGLSRITGVFGAPQSGSTLNDVLGGI